METHRGEGDRIFMRCLRTVGPQFLPCERGIFKKRLLILYWKLQEIGNLKVLTELERVEMP